jgi:polyisoprenoid-binding protein YceI
MPRLPVLALLIVLYAPAAAVAASANPADAPAGHYEMDPRHASLTASVLHMGLSHYTLRFDHFTAKFDYDPAHPTASKIEAQVDVSSLDVGDPSISRQFAGEFLDASAHPQATFVSSTITMTDPNHGTVAGDLTLRGVTHPEVLDVTFNGTSPGMMGLGGHRMGFSATTTIKRSDFGSQAWQGVVGDEVRLGIEAEFARH